MKNLFCSGSYEWPTWLISAICELIAYEIVPRTPFGAILITPEIVERQRRPVLGRGIKIWVVKASGFRPWCSNACM